jgi:hypothetical protein
MARVPYVQREQLSWDKALPRAAVFAVLLLTLTIPAAAERRTALVIGNAAYEGSSLQNPVHDATDMAAALRPLGFEVTLLRDVDLRAMREALDTFSRQLRQGGVGLFYFAGHGVQVGGENYLIPLRTNISREQDVPYEALPVGRILGGMEDAENQLNIVILDACRNNPYARAWRSSSRGLVAVQATRGSLIAYATAPGAVAIDGNGRNGLYTAALLKHITTPELNVEQLFKRVRAEVVEATHGTQTPWESSSLLGDFAFALQTPGQLAVPDSSALSRPPLPTPPRSAGPASEITHDRRAISCPSSEPAAFRVVKELGSLEADDDLNHTTYNFVICEERDTAKDEFTVNIRSGWLTGTSWTGDEAREMAARMEREGVQCNDNAPYGPGGKNDHRRINYRLCQSKGKPVAVVIRVITLKADATPYPEKQLVVDWPQ